MKKNNQKIIVFLPAYNEEEKIVSVIKAVPKEICGCKVEVLVVNDGSKDKTKELVEKSGVTVVSHLQNEGVGRAFQTGLEVILEMGADIMVNIDSDGQFSPKEITNMVRPIIEDGVDFVVGDRFINEKCKLRMPKNMPQVRYYGNLVMAKLISFLVKQKFNDVSCGFRAYSKKALLMLNLTGKFTYTQESFIDLASKGLKIQTVPVKVKYFLERKSRVANNLFYYTLNTLKIILRTFRDYKPLAFFVYISIIPLIVSVASGLFLSVHYLYIRSFTPYKTIGFIFIYFSAFTFTLWMLGFLADMFTRIRLNQEKILFYEKTNYLNNYKNRQSENNNV